MRRVVAVATIALLLGGAAGTPAVAQSPYPTKPVRMIVPFTPGGPTDLVARLVSHRLGEALGQQFIVESRPGAGGVVGSEATARAAADGYTLLTGTVGTHAINASLHARLPYDPVKDFAAVAMLASVPNLLLVHPSVPAKSVAELIALAKTKPGQMNFGSGGNGSTNHLAGELFKTMAGIDISHVPYKGNAPSMTDLVAGHIPMMFDAVSSALPNVKAGKVRALGVTSPRRSPILPDVPAIAESLPGFEVSLWFGVFAPAGTPKEVVTKLNTEILRILAAPDVRERLAGWGAEPGAATPEQFAAQLRSDIAKWAKVVKESGARVD